MLVGLTKITNAVIAANTIVSSLIANGVIEVRHVSAALGALSPANDYVTYLTVTANVYNTWNWLQSNIGGGSSSNTFILKTHTNTNTSTATSNVYYIGSTKTPNLQSNVTVYIDGIYQSPAEWVFHSGNNTVQIIDASLPAGLIIDIVARHQP
jgi:hypothetical protein